MSSIGGSSCPSASPRQCSPEDRSGRGDVQWNWLRSKAASLEGHVQLIRENGKTAVQDIAQDLGIARTAAPRYDEERFDVTFIERALGLELDLARGALVRAVKAGGQAERLQVLPEDRLVAIAGEALPQGEGTKEFIDAVQQRMRAMPRPVTMSFLRLVAAESPAEGPPEEPLFSAVSAVKKGLAMAAGGGKDTASMEQLAEELEAARELARRFKAEAEEAREEARQQADDAIAAVEEAAALRADLAELQRSKAWVAKETQRCSTDVEAALKEAATARAELAASADELARLRATASTSQAVVAAEREAAASHRAEAERLQACAARAAAAAEEAARERDDLDRALRDAAARLAEAEALRAEEARQASLRLDAANARAAEARGAGAESVEAARAAEARAEAAAGEAKALAEALEAARHDAQRSGASERLLGDLRREVERLRRDLAAAERAAEARAPTQAPEPQADGGAAAARPAPPQELEIRVAELQQQNEALRRQLDARPIVFQFGPSADDEDDEEAEQAFATVEDEEIESQEAELAASSPPSMSRADSGPGRRPPLRLLAYGAALWLKRRARRGFAVLRRQRHAQSLERTLRSFTRQLATRPWLLWLWYGHVFLLWFLEAWRQAMAQALPTDPAQRIGQIVEGSRAAPGRGP